ncbi:unnamed protein product [Rhizophagus irregularis]|nr:unnamed protein product [Rhizophagus irregularis]
MAQKPDDWATLACIENKDKIEEVLNLFRNAIDNDEMPKAKELLQVKKGSNSIKRPPNYNIIYVNQLGKFGLLDIIRKFCDEHGINKQNMVPICKKISKILWDELSVEHKNFFSNLAIEVEREHRRLYPNYKYRPMRKIKSVYKYYEHNKSKIKPADHVSSHMNNTPAHMPVTSQDVNDEFEQIDDDSYDDSYDESSYGGSYVSYTDYEDLNSFDDDLPTFSTHTKLSPLSNSTYYEMQDESYSNSSTSFNHPQQTINFQSSFHDINADPDLFNTEIRRNSIFWSDALEARLCELYGRDDVVDIFWGQPVEERLKDDQLV